MKAQYSPKHKPEVGPQRPEQVRRRKTSRIVYLCIAAVYLAVTVGATVYAQTGYIERLPVVRIERIEKGLVPVESLQGSDETGYVLNSVVQEDGPWGKRYLVRQIDLLNWKLIDDTTAFAYEVLSLEEPVVVFSEMGFLYEGQEVRLF